MPMRLGVWGWETGVIDTRLDQLNIETNVANQFSLIHGHIYQMLCYCHPKWVPVRLSKYCTNMCVDAQHVWWNKKCFKLSSASENEVKSFSGLKSSVLWIFQIVIAFSNRSAPSGKGEFTISQLSLFTWELRLVLQAQGAQLITWTM